MQEEFIAYANSKGLDEHLHLHTLSRAFAARKQIFSLTLATVENILMHFFIINIYALTNSSCCVDQISLGWIIVYIVGPMRRSVDPNEILHDRYSVNAELHIKTSLVDIKC